jgi:hypothetical protein
MDALKFAVAVLLMVAGLTASASMFNGGVAQDSFADFSDSGEDFLSEDPQASGKELSPPRIVREASRIGSPPPRSTVVALRGSKNKGGRIAVHAARMWLMERGLRVVESRSSARQIVIVEYTHPLTVQIRGVDLESGEVQWAGAAHVEGDLNQVDASILTELTRQALEVSWGLPQ